MRLLERICISYNKLDVKEIMANSSFSIGTAGTIAASTAINQGKILTNDNENFLGFKGHRRNIIDSKDLWTTLTTCIETTDKSVKGDVNVIRYEFETKNIS